MRPFGPTTTDGADAAGITAPGAARHLSLRFERSRRGPDPGSANALVLARLSRPVPTPLAAWIQAHRTCRHNLGESGMQGVVGPVRPTDRAVRTADAALLRRLLAEDLDVAPDRLFLTHGATEANGWVVLYLARSVASSGPRNLHALLPEYPPLVEVARWAGFRPANRAGPSALGVLSNPRNPEGRWLPPAEIEAHFGRARELLVDETFREFARKPTYEGRGRRGVWRTGTFTKFYGADAIRVGWVVAPEEHRDAFDRFHAHFVDQVAPYAVASAIATRRARARIRRAVGRVFDRNVALIRADSPKTPALAAPVWFDRPVPGGGRRLALRAARASVLVCPGDLFGDPAGVRVGLTRPTFPVDFAAYRAVRDAAGSRSRR
jgi:aspartate/methionine/tyrosine aminotransferase